MNKEKCIFRNKDGRRKLYAYTFLISILVITGMGIVSIWQADFLDLTANKIIGTSIILGGLGALLYALSFKGNEKTESILVFIVAGSFSLLCILLVAEIWFDLFEAIFLLKITQTLLVIGIISGVVSALKYDFFENKKLKDDNYLD